MFCPKCGVEGKGLCVNCFLEKNHIILKPVKIPLCSCGNYYYMGYWIKDIKDHIKDIIKKNLIIPTEIKLKTLHISHKILKNKIDLNITVSCEYSGEEFIEEIHTLIETENKTCSSCKKRSANYYEAILQIRTKNSRLELEVDPLFVSNTEKVRGGFDFYLISTKYGRQFGKEFLKKGFCVKESAKLFGQKNRRDIYRNSISIKDP